MSLFLITGSASTGKTTICEVLKKKGYTAYDVDVDGLAKWTNLKTGYVHPKSSIKKSDRTPEFLAAHRWHVPRNDIQRLLHESESKTTFLCGHLGNLDEVVDLFSGVFVLNIEDQTLRDRLCTRTGNDWGVQEHEIEQTLKNHHILNDKYKSMGAVIIDANQSPEQVTEDILSKIQ
jgi:broad-specificity NMP kinase